MFKKGTHIRYFVGKNEHRPQFNWCPFILYIPFMLTQRLDFACSWTSSFIFILTRYIVVSAMQEKNHRDETCGISRNVFYII